jgi:cytidylate kinase
MESNLFSGLELTAEVVDRQLRKWNALQQAARQKNKTASMSAPAYRFLTIARDRGSLGDEVAQELSKRLGWHVFDKEIVTFIAKDRHTRENLIRQLEETPENLAQDMIERFLKMTMPAYVGNWEYHESLIKTLAYLAKNGSAIIVGRGANFVLRDEQDGLNVRITASEENRIHRISESLKVPHEEARLCMHEDDEERRKFIHQHFRQDVEDERSYDIVFNTDRASADRIASSILCFMKNSTG